MASPWSSSSSSLLPSPAAAVPATPEEVSGPMDDDSYEPAKGSWVAEYEEAKLALTEALRSGVQQEPPSVEAGGVVTSEATVTNDDATVTPSDAIVDDAVLEAYLRLCRAYSKLRRWDRVLIVSKKAINYARASWTTTPDRSGASDEEGAMTTTADVVASSTPSSEATMRSIRTYRQLAKAELVVSTSLLDQNDLKFSIRFDVLVSGDPPEGLRCHGYTRHLNVNMLQEAVLLGDVRLMEEVVALGAPIDIPTEEPDEDDELADYSQLVVAPAGASALLMACAILAAEDSTAPEWVRLTVASMRSTIEAHDLDRVTECAMQLVHLGADPNMVMPPVPRGVCPAYCLWEPFEGKSAFQIAAMSKRRPLVALMWEHMQLSPEARAEVVHCRCGSRLPWKHCHSTGPGQPRNYSLRPETTQDVCYRLSPLGRCPCWNSQKTYYKCCWRDNRFPIYMHDKTGALLGGDPEVKTRLARFVERLFGLADRDRRVGITVGTYQERHEWILHCGRFIREFPFLFTALCEDVGPKSRMTEWDPHVYAGCLERLDRPFFWRDVHWDLDRSILRWRCDEWNKALHKYCNDAGLVGAERDLVLCTHAANPCAPCGRVDCSAFEGKVRQFRRCAGCKAISYCSRKCQKKDWAEHQQLCRASQVFWPGDC